MAVPPDAPTLRGIFEAQLREEQLATLREAEKTPSLERLVGAMTAGKDSQRAEAKVALDAWGARTEDPAVLADIARGYRLLGFGDDALAAAARLRALRPTDGAGYALAAEVLYEEGKAAEIDRLARAAAAAGVADPVLESYWKLSRARSGAGKRGVSGEGSLVGDSSELPFKPAMRMGPIADPPSAPVQPSPAKIPDGAVPLAAGLLLTAAGLAWRLKGRELAKDAWEDAKQTAAVGAIIVGLLGTGYGGYLMYTAVTATSAVALAGGGAVATAVAVDGVLLAEGAVATTGGGKLAAAGYSYAKSQRQFERSAGKRPSLDDLSRAGQAADRNGLTKAGRALQKHGDRSGSAFPKIRWKDLNAKGQEILDDILTSPGAKFEVRADGILRVRDPSGRGASFNPDGSFRGFLEP